MTRPAQFQSQSKPIFQLIQGGLAAAAAPTQAPARPTWHIRSFNTVQEALLAVLQAKVSPTKTVEEACHLDFPYLEDKDICSSKELDEDYDALHEAGLSPRSEFILPSRIIIFDQDKFAATFPDLVNAIPIMLAHQGVQPYTKGEPGSALPVAVQLFDERERRKTLPHEWNPSSSTS